jgi:transcriptional regulator with XRE-family HTH domain
MKKEHNDNRIDLNLEIIRKKLGITQRELAFFLQISKRSVVRYENGKSEPTFNFSQIKRLDKLLKMAGYRIEDLPDKPNNDSAEKKKNAA